MTPTAWPAWLAMLFSALLLATAAQAAERHRTEPLGELDKRYMEQQRQRVDRLLRLELGEQLRGDARDLELVQTLLDRKLIAADDRETLQALGIILGDRLQQDLGLIWTVYTDRRGRSRALEIPGWNEFLFPVTMISRRAEVGATVDVQTIYDRAAGIVKEVRARSAPF